MRVLIHWVALILNRLNLIIIGAHFVFIDLNYLNSLRPDLDSAIILWKQGG